jgi:DNA mismatch endonuclease (patch repair protein)
MSRIRKTNTLPELLVRKVLYKLRYRFRLYKKDLPGCPDIVLSRIKKIIFVHGCFWHRHNCSLGKRTPKSKTKYWIPKLLNNKKRDTQNIKKLKLLGWDVLIIWECEIKKDLKKTEKRIINFLKNIKSVKSA